MVRVVHFAFTCMSLKTETFLNEDVETDIEALFLYVENIMTSSV